jgi:hypothetical protein
MYDEKFLDDLPDDPILAASELCKKFKEFHLSDKEKRTKAAKNNSLLSTIEALTVNETLYDQYLEAIAIFQAFCETHQLKFNFPGLTSDKKQNIERIVAFFDVAILELTKNVADITVTRIKTKYAAKFGKGFLYEFSQGDLDRIQQLINELRDKISICDDLEENHKSRLMKRLERLQSELHKKVSDLDRFWGLVGDAGVVLNKLGKDAKPIVDRIREIAEIAWRTQSRAEELPSDTPLPQISHDKKE